MVKVLPQGYDTLYARWYVQFEDGFNFNARNHGSGLHGGPRNNLGTSGNRPSGNWFSSIIDYSTSSHQPVAYTYYRGMYQDCFNPNGSCFGDHFPGDSTGIYAAKPNHQAKETPPTFESGKWYSIEMMIDAGTPVSSDSQADGILNYWIDGVEIGEFDQLWFRNTASAKIQTLWLSLFHHDGLHSVEGIMLDNVVMATERIGPLVTAVPEPNAMFLVLLGVIVTSGTQVRKR